MDYSPQHLSVMKSRSPFLSRVQLFIMAGVAACALAPIAESAMMHADIDQRTYTDFAQNLGRYKATGVSTLLQAIREKDGGIALVNEKGEITGTLSLTQGMIDFSGVQNTPGTFYHGAGAALGNNFLVTAAHNGTFSAQFGAGKIGSHAISYGTVATAEANGDFTLYRQNKIFTDVVGSSVYSGMSSDTEASSLIGKQIYRAGGGVHYKFTDYAGTREHVASAYTFLAGGIGTISGASFSGYDNTDTYRISWGMDITGAGVGNGNPLPITTNGGDSGSPIFIYNETSGEYEYLFALTGDSRYNWSIGSGAIKWTNDTIASFNKAVDLSTTPTATLGAVSAATSGKAATGTITVGDTTIEFLGVATGTHTWKSLSDRKDIQNWYAYGNGYQNGISGLGNTNNLVFTGSAAETNHDIILSATVDTGVGYLEFNKGKFTIKNADDGNYMLNSAGYVVNAGAEVHLQLTNDSEDYMREWRKNGEGDLYIEGTGNTNALLTVGGSGSVYLQRESGYSGYNVLASSGATVVIKDVNQIARDFTFGMGGATLDMNGNSMNWYTTNSDVSADGFSVNALTDEAVITNTASSATTLTYKQSGETVYNGSFKDSASGAIKIVADAGTDSVWTLNGICTDLSQNAESGIEVKSGKVVLAGTNTVHGSGSVEGSSAVFFSEDDWHYADARANVIVQNGATFELGSHARLKGDVTVNGGTYVMGEGVRHRMEYIEGGLIKEDTYEWSDYYGHHGNTTLADGGTLSVKFSAGTTANNTYAGNITGTGTMTVDAADGIFTLTGDNTFTGTRSVVGGTLVVEDAAAAGSVAWVIGEKGVFAAQGMTGTQMLSYVDGTSSGVLALVKDDTQVDVSNHKNLIIGALAGTTVQYGTAGTTEALTAVDNVWRLGGGGGELVVNYHLTGANKLILGNGHAKGIVTLANTENDFTGGIDFMGSGVTLNYNSEDAIKNVSLNLTYGNRVAMTNLIKNITESSDGILLQYQAGQDLDLSGHQNLSLGATGDLNYTGKITVADGQTYRFSAASGTFAVNTEIGGAHDIVVDAQTYTGGTLVLNNLSNFTGSLTVAGYDSTKTSDTGGVVTLSLTQDNVLDDAETVTLKAGGTLYIGETTQKITKLVSEAGSVLTGSVTGNQYSPTRTGTLHLTIENLSDIKGTVCAGTIHKYGSNTLELSGATNFQYSSLIIEEGNVKLTGTAGNAYTSSLNIKNNTLYLNGNALTGYVTAEDGGTIDASTSGSSISGLGQLLVSEGTATMTNGGNAVSVSGVIGALDGATLKLTGTGAWTFASYSYNSGGTLQVEATEMKFTNNYSTITTSGTLELLSSDAGSDVAINFAGTYSQGAQELKFNRIKIDNKNLSLEENGSRNAIFTIGSLDGSGTVTWKADLNTSTTSSGTTTAHSSRLVFNNEGDFTGTVTAKRTANGNGYNTFLELAHENALKNATLDLQGISGGNVALAVNTSNTKIKGLNGNEYAVAYGGAASATPLSDAPTTTNDATLTLTGAGSYDYQGAVAGLSVAMNGAGTQTFSGNSVVVKDISALAGTLNFTNAPTLSGSITVAQGATLKLGTSFSLDAGHDFAVVAGTSGEKATLSAETALVLNGGTLCFDGAILSETTSRLSATTSFGSDLTSQSIKILDSQNLELGKTYKLLDGNWSTKSGSVTLADGSPDYLQGSTFAAGTSGLTITLKLQDGFVEWQDNQSVFADGNTVLFRDSDPSKELNFAAATSAAGARFANDETYSFSGGDVTLSGTLTADSGKLVVNNKLSANSYASTNGEIEIAQGGTLALTATQSGSVAVNNISGTGTLEVSLSNSSYDNTLIADSDFAGTTRIRSGNFNLDKSTFGNTLKMASGVNAQINSTTTLENNLVLEGTSQIHQNSGNNLAVNGTVSGENGTWNRRGGGTLDFNGTVNLSAFTTTGADGTATNFNAQASIGTVTVDQTNITLGGTGTLTTENFNLSAGKTVSVDTLKITETGTQTRSWNGNVTTTVNLKNNAIVDTRNTDYSVAGTMTVGGSDAAGTIFVNGIVLSPEDTADFKGTLNVSAGAHLVVTGETSGTTASDFVLAVGGEKSQLMAGANKLNIDGTLTSNAAMTLYYKSADLTVGDGGRLNLLGGLQLKGAAYNDWLGDGNVKGTLNVLDGGKLYAAGGTQRSELVVSLASGSTLGAIGEAGKTVTFSNNMTIGTAETTGTFIVDTSANTADTDFNLSASTTAGAVVDMTGTLTWQGTTALDVVGNGTLKHKSAFNNASAIRVQKNATLAVDSSAALSRTAELNEGTLALSDGASVTADLRVNTSGTIRASGTISLSGTTTLNSGAILTYDVATNTNLSSTQALVSSDNRGSVVKNGAGTLNLNNAGDAVSSFRASAGTINVHGSESYGLTDLTLDADTVAGFYKDAVGSTTEANVSVRGTASFGAGAHLNANLSLSVGAELEVAESGLSMGSTVTLEQGIFLGAETLARADALTAGETLTLFTSVDQLILGSGDNAKILNPSNESNERILAENYFANISGNSFELYFTGTEGNGTIGLFAIPEPSLFGLLAGLGALVLVGTQRRRR